MEVIQVVKKLNNTELGKGGTHDTYVLVPQNLDITDLFPDVNEQIGFVYKRNGEVVNIRHTAGREKRIVGLGPFYSENDVSAGDEIVFERQIVRDKSRYYINLHKKNNIVVLQKMKNGFEILMPERKELINKNTVIDKAGESESICINFISSEKKRQDSPDTTDFYDVKVGGYSVLNDYSWKEILEIEINNNKARLNRFCAWKKYKFKVEDEYE